MLDSKLPLLLVKHFIVYCSTNLIFQLVVCVVVHLLYVTFYGRLCLHGNASYVALKGVKQQSGAARCILLSAQFVAYSVVCSARQRYHLLFVCLHYLLEEVVGHIINKFYQRVHSAEAEQSIAVSEVGFQFLLGAQKVGATLGKLCHRTHCEQSLKRYVSLVALAEDIAEGVCDEHFGLHHLLLHKRLAFLRHVVVTASTSYIIY